MLKGYVWVLKEGFLKGFRSYFGLFYCILFWFILDGKVEGWKDGGIDGVVLFFEIEF